MTHKYDLVMYSRTFGCPFITVARRVLADYAVPYRELYIDKDMEARQRVQLWTGFLSVPTLVAAEPGADLPFAPPRPLEPGRSPRGVNRGSIITEAYAQELTDWLAQHGFITKADAAERSEDRDADWSR